MSAKNDTGPGAPGAPPRMRRFLSLPTLASLALAVAFLSFLVSRFDVDLAATWAQVRGSNPLLYLLAAVSFYASFLVRGFRWRLIAARVGFHRQGDARLPSVLECALLSLLGWFGNTIAWLRMGDAYRVYTFSHASGSGVSQALGTMVADRIADVVAIFVLLLVATAGLFLDPEVQPSALFLVISLALAALALLGMLLMSRFGLRVARLLPRPMQEGYVRFQRGALASTRRIPVTVSLGAGAWLLEAGRLFLVVKALGFSLTSSMVLFTAMANGLLTSVPLTPGGLGIVEPGLVGLLTLALPKTSAVSVVTLDRSISFLSVILVGGLTLLLQRLWLKTPSR